MKKVLMAASKVLFAMFSVAVLGLLMSLTYSALTRIFPESLINRMWGLVMFDIAAMAWALAFAFTSETIAQYAIAALGFIVGFVGTIGMVAAEVALSSNFVDAADLGEWMVYGFIIVTALHAALTYAHHATSSSIAGQIEVGIARGEIVSEARRAATAELDEAKAELGKTMSTDIVSQVKRDLGLIEVEPTMPFVAKKRAETTMPKGLNVVAPDSVWNKIKDQLAPYAIKKTTMPLVETIRKEEKPNQGDPFRDESAPE